MRPFSTILVITAAACLNTGSGQDEGPPPPGRRPSLDLSPSSRLLEALDRDHDGTIGDAELKDATAALSALDANRNGQLEAKEWRRGPDGEGRPRRESPDRASRPTDSRSTINPSTTIGGFDPQAFLTRVFSHDQDGDGVLSEDELPESMARLLDKNDINNDGKISRPEVEASIQRMKERFDRSHQRGDNRRRPRPRPPKK